MNSDPPQTALAEWRQSWTVVIGSAIGVAFGFSTFPYVSSLFIEPLHAAFGWSRGTQAVIQYAYVLVAFASPMFGSMVDRQGVRRIALSCIPLVALAYLALALMPGSLALYYALMGVLVLVGQGTSGVVYTRAVVAAFDHSRGLALAASRVGLAIASAAMPPLVFAAIDHAGWRAGYALLAAFTLALAGTATIFWVREPQLPSAEARVDRRSLFALLAHRKVLVLIAAAALMLGPIIGLLSQLQPILTGKGIAPADAAALIGALSLSVVAGTFVTGLLADRIWAPVLGLVFSLGGAIGCLGLALSGALSWPAGLALVMLIGIAQGAEMDLLGYLIARYFGLANFAKIFGLGNMLVGICSGIAGLGFGLSFDLSGDYGLALGGAAMAMGVAAVLFMALGPYPEKAGPGTSA